MKKLKLIIPFLVFALAYSGSVFAGEPSWTSGKYQKDNTLIKEDQAAINLHEQQIIQLKGKLKNEKAAGNEEAVIITKRDLAKERADLRQSKAYLCADKKDLKRDYRLSMKNYRGEISKDQANLKKYRTKLDKDIANGNEEAISATASKIAYYQNKLNADRALLNREANTMDANFAAINNERDRTIVQPSSSKPETAYASNNKRYK